MILAYALVAVLIALTIALVHALLPHLERKRQRTKKQFHKDAEYGALGRAHDNPILPRGTEPWEAEAVMNPGAILDEDRTHLFYRAIGTDGVSRIGYASSTDGVHVDERLPYPVFALAEGDAMRAHLARMKNTLLHPGLAVSGGSWSGTEDPRAVVIDGRLYLSFSAFNGWQSLRMGVVSLSLDDMRRKDWNWSEPMYLSAPDEIHKNWVLFPEKIDGKFAVLHSLNSGMRDRVLIEYLDTLDAEPVPYVKSVFRPTKNERVWDSTLRGAGPPPVRTPYGWLLLYHATDAREPHRYKVGGMLLDERDPRKVLARSKRPVLAPDAWYENEGAKSGVVYASGAVVRGDDLTVYYGGADTVVCAAAASLKQFVRTLLIGESATLTPLAA